MFPCRLHHLEIPPVRTELSYLVWCHPQHWAVVSTVRNLKCWTTCKSWTLPSIQSYHSLQVSNPNSMPPQRVVCLWELCSSWTKFPSEWIFKRTRFLQKAFYWQNTCLGWRKITVSHWYLKNTSEFPIPVRQLQLRKCGPGTISGWVVCGEFHSVSTPTQRQTLKWCFSHTSWFCCFGGQLSAQALCTGLRKFLQVLWLF